MRSIPVLTSFFSTRKYFTILFKILDFLRSLNRFKVLIRLIKSEFYMAWRKNFTKLFTYLRGTFVPNVQTMSTSLMSRLVKKFNLRYWVLLQITSRNLFSRDTPLHSTRIFRKCSRTSNWLKNCQVNFYFYILRNLAMAPNETVIKTIISERITKVRYSILKL